MPTKSGKLLPAELAEIEKRFTALEEKRGRDIECDVCSAHTWSISNNLAGNYSDSAAGASVAGYRTPTVIFICSECGQVKQFAAVAMGIDPAEHRDDESPADGN